MSLEICALNVASPSEAAAARVLAHLAGADWDVAVLSEVGTGAGSRALLGALRTSGHEVLTSDLSELGVAVVSRGLELAPLPPVVLPELPGRVLPVAAGGVRLLAAYGAASDPVRYASQAQRARKRAFLSAFVEAVAGWLGPRSAVVGDLNICDPVHAAHLPYVLAEETAAYIALLGGIGLVDAWREANPEADEASWVDHSGVGCRYDHALVTEDLRVTACRLDHTTRPGVSDHSALHLRVT